MNGAWKFPPSFHRSGSGLDLIDDEADIIQSVRVLFSTKPGERFLVPDYGFDWGDLMFEPANGQSNSLFNREYLRQRLGDVLAVFEPRVELESVQVSAEAYGGKVAVEMLLMVKASGRKLVLNHDVEA
ncbi:hypothetical protein C4J81_05680 [Deltaproteobacteria bacterium Smac51]|nr:hypothetical protein C4J81_05680 [Deltaproteobacteria bacterium Smac51]